MPICGEGLRARLDFGALVRQRPRAGAGALLGTGRPAPRSSVACRLISGTLASALDNVPSRWAVAAMSLKPGFVEAVRHSRRSPCDAVITTFALRRQPQAGLRVDRGGFECCLVRMSGG
jgi:hypothetical protein